MKERYKGTVSPGHCEFCNSLNVTTMYEFKFNPVNSRYFRCNECLHFKGYFIPGDELYDPNLIRYGFEEIKVLKILES